MLCAAVMALIQADGPQFRSVELSRGGAVEIAGRTERYWGVSDTYLDMKQPEVNFGGQAILSGGPNRPILIRFGDLNRVVGPNWEIAGASLVFEISGGNPRGLKTVTAVRHEWGEGPRMTLTGLQTQGDAPHAPRGAACWKWAQFGNATSAWKGAQGGDSGEFQSTIDTKLTITGIQALMQRAVDRPWENFGLALAFDQDVDLVSTQAKVGRPKLQLSLRPKQRASQERLIVRYIHPVAGSGVEAVVWNAGKESTAATLAHWVVEGSSQEPFALPSIAAGQKQTFQLKTLPRADGRDHRFATVDFVADSPADAYANERWARYYVGGIDSSFGLSEGSASTFDAQEALIRENARIINEVLMPQSQYSFAPEGCLERVNYIGPASGAATEPMEQMLMRSMLVAIGLKPTIVNNADHPTSEPFAGVMGGGDTRDDTFVAPKVPLSPLPSWPVEESTGLLAMNDVAFLNARLNRAPIKAPTVALLRILNRSGDGLARVDLEFYDPANLTTPAHTMRVAAASGVLLPASLKHGNWVVKATFGKTVAWTWLKEWQLLDSAARGNTGVAVIELRLNLPTDPLDVDNLAKARPVQDNAGSDLSKITDETNMELVKLPEKVGDWIEIDLRRDRTIAEITLETLGKPMWRQFEIRAYGTGDKPTESYAWMNEGNWDWSLLNIGDGLRVPYHPATIRARFIRIVNVSGGAGNLSGLRVRGVKGGFGG